MRGPAPAGLLSTRASSVSRAAPLLRRPLASCREGDAARQGVGRGTSNETGYGRPVADHRAWDGGVYVLAVVSGIAGPSIADVGAAFAAISPRRWALAIGATALAYFALAWYDQIALAHLGRRLSWRFVGLVSFTTYALAHNIGATVLSGALVRYRAYSTKGLGMAEVGVLVAFCSFTFTLGNVSARRGDPAVSPRAGAALRRDAGLGGRLLGVALFGGPCLYTIGSLLHFAPLQDPRFRIGLSASADRGAAIARRAVGADRRGRDHLFRAAAGGQSRLRHGARGVPRLATPSRSSAMRPAASASWNIRFSRRCPTRRPPACSRRCLFSACSILFCRCCSRSSSSSFSSAGGSASWFAQGAEAERWPRR